jgi:transposase
MAEQDLLLTIESGLEKGAALAPEPPTRLPAARLKDVDRSQSYWGAMVIEELIPADHLARAIWEVTEKLDFSGFLKDNKSVEGKQGRERWDPRLLASVWVYAYSQGIGAAREIERQMEHEPGLRWLTGNGKVNYHSLSDFRVDHGEAVEKLFSELLGMLSREGLLDLAEVTQDGTKIRAAAGGSSLKREKTLQEHIVQAEEAVRKLSQADQAEQVVKRKEAAQKRAAEERKARLEQAVKELEEIRKSPSKRKKPEEARVSESEPEARVMKDGQGGYGLSYNVQTTTETSYGLLVSVGITQQGNDNYQLEPAVDRMEKQAGQKPTRIIVDGGYINASNIQAMEEKQVELVGPEVAAEERQARNQQQSLAQAGIAKEFGQQFFVIIEDGKALRCPAGKQMGRKQNAKNYSVYQASRKDCEECGNRAQCCPKSGARTIKIRKEKRAVKAYQERMREEATKAIYRQRGPVAEFPHAWIKDKLGLRKFHVRGLIKAGIEALWVAVTYDIQQWVRLRWRQPAVAPTLAAA